MAQGGPMTGRQYEKLLAKEGHSQSCIHFEHKCSGCPCECHKRQALKPAPTDPE